MGRVKNVTRAVAKMIVPPLGYLLMRFYWHTSPIIFEVEGTIPESQCVVVCWHGELLLSPQAYRYVHPKQVSSGIISRHFDGDIIANVLRYFAIKPLKGSSSKGAKQVLLEAFRALKKGDDLLVTPDGPRGPRHHISDGAVALARKASIPILTVNYTTPSYWQLKSWDRFVIPKPFQPITFYLKVLDVNHHEQEEAKAYLQEQMLKHTILS